MSKGTAEYLGVSDHHRTYLLFPGVFVAGAIKKWNMLPFLLQHDAVQPVGFLIKEKDITKPWSEEETLLFIPDTAYVENKFQGVTLVAVECNNIAEILSRNILEGHIPAVVGRRVRRNHMSLENLIQMLKANDLSRCRAIYLMHLSDGNSDEKRMRQQIQEATGIPTYALK